MSLYGRITNIFRRHQVDETFDEELQTHIDEAIASGRSPEEIRRAIGSPLRHREESRSIRIAPWLDSLTSDIIFGFRQLKKNRVTSAAAILSLALAIGACTGAFRLIDATLFRPLPVANPERLYFAVFQYLDREGKLQESASFSYPLYREMRDAVRQDADLLAIGYASRNDITYGSDQDMEKAAIQNVSGSLFPAFGLKPALGRLLTPADDVTPGKHPYAVISHSYWTRRFGRNPSVIGKRLQGREHSLEIIGVLEEGFTGTEPGMIIDIFVPTMMNAEAINDSGWSWMRTWVQMKPGASVPSVRERLQATFTNHRRDRAKGLPSDMPREQLNSFLNAPLVMKSASSGASDLQGQYREALLILAVVVGLVLLIACANVANLMTAQAAARAKEMALRVSIGAGKWRLIQLVLVESALIAIAASLLGALFAWWSAPFVIAMLSRPNDPLQIVLDADWRVFGFGLTLATVVTFLFGLIPALRASGVKPSAALKGGEDPHQRRRLMNSLVAAQVAFCILVHFVAGLFMATFQKLSNQPVGFVAENLLLLNTVAKEGEQQPERWREIADGLRTVHGVEDIAVTAWPLMGGSGRNKSVRVAGRAPDNVPCYFLGVSPGFLRTMRIPLIDGRDFRPEDTIPRVDAQQQPHAGVAIVNEEFARHYFDGQSPLGRSFEMRFRNIGVPVQIVGYMRDSRYYDLREIMLPTVYLPMEPRRAQTLVVRISHDSPTLAPALRQEVSRLHPNFRVSDISTQTQLVRQWSVRERLLAALSLFFAGVALLLAAVGLYGVLHYSVLQRRREIGIRMALGARSLDVVRRISTEVFAMLVLGSAAGLAAGIASESFFKSLLFDVKATDWRMLAIPTMTLMLAAILAALPPIFRAVRIDPSEALRSE